MKREEHVKISISLPRKLLEEVDRFCKEWGYTRSELFRDAVTHYMLYLEYGKIALE